MSQRTGKRDVKLEKDSTSIVGFEDGERGP